MTTAIRAWQLAHPQRMRLYRWCFRPCLHPVGRTFCQASCRRYAHAEAPS